MLWLSLSVCSFAQVEGGVIKAGESFTHEEDVIWRSVSDFASLLDKAQKAASYEEELANLKAQKALLEQVEAALRAENEALRDALEASKELVEISDRIAGRNMEAFESTDRLLVKERKKNRPFLNHGLTVAVTCDGVECDDPNIGIGYGILFDFFGRRD